MLRISPLHLFPQKRNQFQCHLRGLVLTVRCHELWNYIYAYDKPQVLLLP